MILTVLFFVSSFSYSLTSTAFIKSLTSFCISNSFFNCKRLSALVFKYKIKFLIKTLIILTNKGILLFNPKFNSSKLLFLDLQSSANLFLVVFKDKCTPVFLSFLFLFFNELFCRIDILSSILLPLISVCSNFLLSPDKASKAFNGLFNS